ncbi:helix-turn-helix transcriptional regulator [Amycolatopsis tolypomycina]|uniref:DNA-binding response regulator, NarL/FixJ family, contains REC and HTH domains n=1 Tax=Amycolatopsis tolypomycina TaxID=208445 RepID=A0A1H5C2V8_9PSEU|nr:LuxR C-terminal-related transcriptional regulator [Amycolatopsis tolypomycina]SED60966.1 DNA-binding response regulator, NarL/FixJ family, contains REC and HTH domains [Amycolatopsis tolypomycina]
MDQVRVAAWASDPIALAGLINHLKSRPELLVLPRARRGEAAVLVFAVGEVDREAVAALRAAAAESPAAIVLVAGHVDPAHVGLLADCHVSAVLPRTALDRLTANVLAAARGRTSPLRAQVEALAAEHGAAALTPREVDVLRLMAEGWDTAEIAGKLCYSERTVKNVIYAMTNRLNLRNRPHAVAYAVRAGVI